MRASLGDWVQALVVINFSKFDTKVSSNRAYLSFKWICHHDIQTSDLVDVLLNNDHKKANKKESTTFEEALDNLTMAQKSIFKSKLQNF